MLKVLVVQVAMAASVAVEQSAVDSVVGTWVIEVHGHQVGLGLEQDGAKLKGTLVIMGRNVLVEGGYENHAFTLANAADEPTKVKLWGRLKDDGTMEGDIETDHGTMHWKAERLKAPPSGAAFAMARIRGEHVGYARR
jgi:hypothetical protein